MRNECLKPPIPEIYDASIFLDAAASAHLLGNSKLAKKLIVASDMEIVREWTEAIWGIGGVYTQLQRALGNPAVIPKAERAEVRMPNADERRVLHTRDGYHCRFCGIPLIRKEVRDYLNTQYPNEAYWGKKNVQQHAGLQAMWLQYDHLVPHARGGDNDLANIVITCAPCNYGRMNYLIEEVGLVDPRNREPIKSTWDGLERLLAQK